jgi:hypothetical protein
VTQQREVVGTAEVAVAAGIQRQTLGPTPATPRTPVKDEQVADVPPQGMVVRSSHGSSDKPAVRMRNQPDSFAVVGHAAV